MMNTNNVIYLKNFFNISHFEKSSKSYKRYKSTKLCLCNMWNCNIFFNLKFFYLKKNRFEQYLYVPRLRNNYLGLQIYNQWTC